MTDKPKKSAPPLSVDTTLAIAQMAATILAGVYAGGMHNLGIRTADRAREFALSQARQLVLEVAP